METKKLGCGTAPVVEPKPSPVQTKISQLDSCNENNVHLLNNLEIAISTLGERLDSVLNPNKINKENCAIMGSNPTENAKIPISCPLCIQLQNLVESNNVISEKIRFLTTVVENITSILDI